MADFCKECSIEMFGKDFGDLAHIAERATVMCEGCGGYVTVNWDGEVIASDQHPTQTKLVCEENER